MKKVLVMEDVEYIRDFIIGALTRAGYEPVEEPTSDLVAAVLDSKLKNVDSFDLCQTLREKNDQIVILMLTGRNQHVDQMTGLMTGADAYLVKPFSPAALLNYLEALIHRVRLEAVRLEEILASGPFILDTRSRSLEKFGEKIRLTQGEYSVLKLLMQHPGRDFSKEEILCTVWGEEEDLKQVDMNIRRLRIKLEDDPNQPAYITTVWGHGYKWSS
ncbi:MAG: response regulator transcription factor [Oscillospiraceae bacterium]|nr:response regulator transcription factor [Oscillospiraceae bacterium]